MAKPTTRQVAFSQSVLSGSSYEGARKVAGYSAGTNPSVVADQCRRHGLLPDHAVLQRAVAAMQKEAADRVLRRLSSDADVLAECLLKAAKEGNVAAIVHSLDRLMGKPPARIEVDTRTEEFRRRVASGELDVAEVLDEARKLLGVDDDNGRT